MHRNNKWGGVMCFNGWTTITKTLLVWKVMLFRIFFTFFDFFWPPWTFRQSGKIFFDPKPFQIGSMWDKCMTFFLGKQINLSQYGKIDIISTYTIIQTEMQHICFCRWYVHAQEWRRWCHIQRKINNRYKVAS